MATRVKLVVAMIMWGGSFVANHELLRTVDTMEIVTARYVMVAVIFLGLLLVRADLRPSFDARERRLIVLAAFLAVPVSQVPVVQGLRYLSPGLTSFIVTMSPAFAALMAFVILGERVRRIQVAGVLLALCGAAVVILLATGEGTDLTVANPLGAALVILTPLGWAAYTILTKPLAAVHRPVTAVASVLIVGALLLLPFYPSTVAALPDLDAAQWGWLLYLVVPGTVLPYMVWFGSLRELSATSTAAALYLVPVAALSWSVAILDEQLTLVGILGALLILVGVALAQQSGPAVVADPPAEPVLP